MSEPSLTDIDASHDAKNFLRQFSIKEITTPLTLHQQESLADHLISSIKSSKEGQLPDYLEEFRRIYEGPNHLDAKLPVLSQLTPRSKRKLAMLPRPNEAELQKVRNIEKMTKDKTGKRLYDELGKKSLLPKSQQELALEKIRLPEPTQLAPLIPKHTQTDVVQNRAANYIESVERHKRHFSEQQAQLERLFHSQPLPLSSASSSAAREDKAEARPAALLSSSSSKSHRVRAPSPAHLQPLSGDSSPVAVSRSLRAHPAAPPPSSSSPSSSSSILVSSSKQVLSTAQQALQARHASFLQSFTVKVFDQMGVDLNQDFNRHRHAAHSLSVLLLHLYRLRLRAAWTSWRQWVRYLQTLTAQQASRVLFRALRRHQWRVQLFVRCERRRLEKQLEETRRRENALFLNRMAAVLTRGLRRYGKMRHIHGLVSVRRAATRIQALFRGRLGRRRAARRKAHMHRLHASALRIQCRYRVRLAHRKVKLLRKLKFVEEWVYEMEQKSSLYRESFTERGAVAYIARVYRAHVLRRKLHRLVFYNHFVRALTIQRVFRGYRVRQGLQARFSALREKKRVYEASALVIQRYVRRYLAQAELDRRYDERDRRQEQRYNAKLLRLAQGSGWTCALWPSGNLGLGLGRRRGFWSGLAFWRSGSSSLEKRALVIQRVYRGHHGRQRASLLRLYRSVQAINRLRQRRHRAAAVLQRVWRGKACRQSLYRAHLSRSAVRLQSWVRVHLAVQQLRALRLQHAAARRLTGRLRRLLRRRAFLLRYRRQQALLPAALYLQTAFFRRVLAQRRYARAVQQARRRQEGAAGQAVRFVQLLACVQLGLLRAGLSRPMHVREYTVSGVDCPAFGPGQALFVYAFVQPRPLPRPDPATLATLRLDCPGLLRGLGRLPGLLDSGPPPPAGSNHPGDHSGQARDRDRERQRQYLSLAGLSLSCSAKERGPLQGEGVRCALLAAVRLGDVSLPRPGSPPLTSTQVDLVFGKARHPDNASHRLAYPEFLSALHLLADLHYPLPAHGNNSTAGGRNRSTVAGEETLPRPIPEPEPGPGEEGVQGSRPPDLGRPPNPSAPAVPVAGFSLQQFVAANHASLRSAKSAALRLDVPALRRQLQCLQYEDRRLCLVLRLLEAWREEDSLRSAWAWLETESRARLGLYATRIQSLARRRLAFHRLACQRTAQSATHRAARLAHTAVLLQSVLRRFLARRRVQRLAQTTLRKLVPELGRPYWYHPGTGTKAYTKPRVLGDCDCYALAVPEPGLEGVVRCTACVVRGAEVNCGECEDSFCKLCFSSLHCKGQRASHRSLPILRCAYCRYQAASRSCLSCVLEPEGKGKGKKGRKQARLKDSLARHERGLFCETCFRFEHQPAHHATTSSTTTTTTAPSSSSSATTTAVRLLYQTTHHAALLHSLLRKRVVTSHRYDLLVQPCEECLAAASAWRCLDCDQVYCHGCLVSLHSLHAAFTRHAVEALPYYTAEMHASYRRDRARQQVLQLVQVLRKETAQLREERAYAAAVRLQAWWRKILYGRLGRRLLKKRRGRLRALYRQRKAEDQAVRQTVAYQLQWKYGRAPALASDTREEKVLGKLWWFQRRLATQYIAKNVADWGWYRRSRTVPRKGVPKTGFHVGALDELLDQARRGGYRLPGRVFLQPNERQFNTTCDLRAWVQPGELVRIQHRYFGVTAVEQASIKLNRRWRGDDVSRRGDVLYRMPTYRGEEGRLSAKLRYVLYDATIGNVLVQGGLHAYRSYNVALRGLSLGISAFYQRHKQVEEALAWKQAGLRYQQAAYWAESYFSTGDAFVNLSSVTWEEAQRRAEMRQKASRQAEREEERRRRREKEDARRTRAYGDDDEDGEGGEEEDEEDEELDRPLSKAGDNSLRSKPGSRASQRSRRGGKRRTSSAVVPHPDDDDYDEQDEDEEEEEQQGGRGSRPSSPSKSIGRSSLSSHTTKKSAKKSSKKRGASGPGGSGPDGQTAEGGRPTKQRTRAKSSKNAKPKDPWYASPEQIEARREREDGMTLAELAAEAGDWKECVDIITENIYYLHVPTNEMMTTVPRAVQAKRQLDFENSRNKKAFDAAHNRIAKLEAVTQHRLLFTGGRKK